RAEVAFFDEAYLGLDAVARALLYDGLMEDDAEHPRSLVLSSQLNGETSDLIERVLLIDHGRLLAAETPDDLRGQAVTLPGNADQGDRFAAARELLHRQTLGRVASARVFGTLSDDELTAAREAGLGRSPFPLQQLVVHLTQKTRNGRSRTGARSTDTSEAFA